MKIGHISMITLICNLMWIAMIYSFIGTEAMIPAALLGISTFLLGMVCDSAIASVKTGIIDGLSRIEKLLKGGDDNE